MNRTTTAALGIVLCAGLAACGTTRDKSELAQKTVEYQCGSGSGESLSAQYTFQGQEALGAKVIFNNQVVDLTRATTSNADMVGNTFRGNGYTWTTEKFSFENAADAKGIMLTQDAASSSQAGGTQTGTATVLARECKPTGTS